MNKQEFLQRLHDALADLPQEERQERLTFYSEMIDDRMEEGLSQEEAVAQIGSIEDILPPSTNPSAPPETAKSTVKPSRTLKAWEILLLVLGSPIWLSLLIAALAILVSIYAAWWSVIISLWACFGAFCGGAFGGIVAGIAMAVSGDAFAGFALLGAGFVCAGLSIFTFFVCKVATKATVTLTKKAVLSVKKRIFEKEAAV